MGTLAKFASVGWMLHKTQTQAEELAQKHWDQLIATNEIRQTISSSLSNTLIEGSLVKDKGQLTAIDPLPRKISAAETNDSSK